MFVSSRIDHRARRKPCPSNMPQSAVNEPTFEYGTSPLMDMAFIGIGGFSLLYCFIFGIIFGILGLGEDLADAYKNCRVYAVSLFWGEGQTPQSAPL